MRRETTAGHTFLQLPLALLGVTYLAWSALIAVPDSRARAREAAAIAGLQSIASAQAQLVAMGAIDSNGDGVGEFGFLGELAGTAPLRVVNPRTGGPMLGAPGATLFPPLLPDGFTNLINSRIAEIEVRRGGYHFKIYLPRFTVAGRVYPAPETGAPGIGGSTAANYPDPVLCASLWSCYAWPSESKQRSQRAFFVNQEGRLLQTRNHINGHTTVRVYGGWGGGPTYDAALSEVPATPGGPIGMAAALGIGRLDANDGNRWTLIR